METRKTYRETLREAASLNSGYLTPAIAEDYGVPKVELRKIANRGAFEKIYRGVYRDPYYPRDENDQLRELLLLLGDEAYLSGMTVLSLLELGDVNPSKVEVTSPRRYQGSLPDVLKVSKPKREERPVKYIGLRCQPIANAIEDVAPRILPDRALEAAADAREQGLLLADEYTELLPKLKHA